GRGGGDVPELGAGRGVPGPVRWGRIGVGETVADHRPRSGRPDRVDGGPDEMPGRGRARRVPGGNRRSGGCDRADDQGDPGEGKAPSTEHSGSFVKSGTVTVEFDRWRTILPLLYGVCVGLRK